MADSDVAVITVNGKTVRIPKETFQFMMISAEVELNRHLHELDAEPEARSSLHWVGDILKYMYGR